MRNKKINLGLALATTACLSALAVEPPAPTVIRQEWRFESDSNPAPAAGGAPATINVTAFGSGWLAELPPLAGGAGGYWDLGAAGSVTCDLSQALASGAVKSLTVRVRQWWDGSVWDLADINLPGAAATSVLPDLGLLGTLGGWVVDETQLVPAAGTPLEPLTITAGSKGAIIDSIVVEVAVISLPPLVLEIQPDVQHPGTVLISWDEALGSATVESTTNLDAAGSWAPLATAPATLSNGRYTVTAPAGDDVRYFRLKQ